MYTFTVDASYDEVSGTTGVGIVIQESTKPGRRGPILQQIAEAHPRVPSSSGEAFAILRALEIAQALCCNHVRIRSDYNWLRRKLRKHHEDGTAPAGEVECQILAAAAALPIVEFRFVPRRKNGIAHALARRGRFLLSSEERHTTTDRLSHLPCSEEPDEFAWDDDLPW